MAKKSSSHPKSRSQRKSRSSSAAAAKRTKPARFVYFFGDGKADGAGNMKPLLGGKGANLAEMTRIGLPVPPGFTITTEVCTYFYAHKSTYPAVAPGADGRGRREHGDESWAPSSATPKRCRCSSPSAPARAIRCPGMMDTILNLGLNDETVMALVARDEERALRVGLLPPFHPDVWRRGHGRAEARRRRSRSVRIGHRALQARAARSARHRRLEAHRGRLPGAGRRASRSWSKNAPARPSRTIRGISSKAPPARSSVPG